MQLFHVIQDAFAILKIKGVFRQVKVYHRGESIYAGYGSGFIRLLGNGQTSHPDVSVVDYEVPGYTIIHDRMGRPAIYIEHENVARIA